jgi:hypothetical protein
MITSTKAVLGSSDTAVIRSPTPFSLPLSPSLQTYKKTIDSLYRNGVYCYKEYTMPAREPKRGGVIAVGLVLLVLVSVIDFVTGYEFRFFIFYFIPVSLYAWFLSQKAAQVIAAASGVVWWVIDRFSGHMYPHELYRVWNALTFFVAFSLVAWAVSDFRRRLETERRLKRVLAEKLEEELHATEEIRKLQHQIQTVCAWTKRIRVEDKWISFEEFLQSHLGIEVTHGISEEAAAELRKQLEEH